MNEHIERRRTVSSNLFVLALAATIVLRLSMSIWSGRHIELSSVDGP
jgi:hypothetical protein